MPETDQREPSPASPPQPNPNPATGWAQPKIGQNWQFRFFYWLMRLGGKARGYHMSNIVTFWYVLFYPSIRRRCRFYLDRRFPNRKGIRRFLDTYRLARNYGSTLVDMMVLGLFGPHSLTADSPDHDRLRELAAGQRGFVLGHAHVGCWQVGMSTLGELPKRVSIVMIPEAQTLSLFNAQATGVIDPRTGIQGVMEMTDALLRGEIVAMMGDRNFGNEQNAVTAHFLGGQVLLPVAPYRLASATGVPVVIMTAPKTASRHYELRLTKIIEVPPGLGRNAQDYAPYAQQFADCIEQFVNQYPWQFYNFYDYWRDASKKN